MWVLVVDCQFLRRAINFEAYIIVPCAHRSSCLPASLKFFWLIFLLLTISLYLICLTLVRTSKNLKYIYIFLFNFKLI